jgi:hypothetical protein
LQKRGLLATSKGKKAMLFRTATCSTSASSSPSSSLAPGPSCPPPLPQTTMPTLRPSATAVLLRHRRSFVVGRFPRRSTNARGRAHDLHERCIGRKGLVGGGRRRSRSRHGLLPFGSEKCRRIGGLRGKEFVSDGEEEKGCAEMRADSGQPFESNDARGMKKRGRRRGEKREEGNARRTTRGSGSSCTKYATFSHSVDSSQVLPHIHRTTSRSASHLNWSFPVRNSGGGSTRRSG